MRRLLTFTAIGALASAPFLSSVPSYATVATCFGKPATIVGTAGADTLTGGPTDVVYGGGGDDTLSGYIVCGGSGADSIYGAYETDNKLSGDGGNDYINGEFGVDTLLGGGGADRIEDTDDWDWPDSYDPGTDVLRGGAGTDEVISTSGADKVYGDAGADTLTDCTRAKTYLYGGADNDIIDATQNYAGTNPFMPDYVSGDGGWDVAKVNGDDIVSSTTERLMYP